MVRFALPILALALGAALAVGLVSCGGRDEEGLLPGENAQQIVDNLNQVEQDAENGDCDGATAAANEVQADIEELGTEVNAQLRDRLADGAEQLLDEIETECVPATTPAPVETEPEETAPETTDEEKTKTNTDTETETTPTTPTTTTTTTPTEPPTAGEGGGVLPPGQSGTPDQSNSGQGSG